MGGWGWDDDPPSADALRLLDNARRLYDRIATIVEAGDPAFSISPEVVLEFHAIATDRDPDPEKPPGKFKTRDNVITSGGVVLRTLPPATEAPRLVAEMCTEIARRWKFGSTVHVAAYALWRLNWIHPFPDGNGKTARAIMYTLLCIGFERMLPGVPALPDLISRTPIRYWRSLESADAACARGETNVSDVESLISDLLEEVLDIAPSDRS